MVWAIMGGVTGAIMGGIAGVEHAVEDESVNLPTIEEYEKLVKEGNFLVVLLGTEEEIKNGEKHHQTPAAYAKCHLAPGSRPRFPHSSAAWRSLT